MTPQEAIHKLILLCNQGQFKIVFELTQMLLKHYPKVFTFWNIFGIINYLGDRPGFFSGAPCSKKPPRPEITRKNKTGWHIVFRPESFARIVVSRFFLKQ